MLTAHQISKSFGIKPLLKDITFNVNKGDRIGLIGLNGSGKTTLLRILVGLESLDSGTITLSPPTLRIGYLAQEPMLPLNATLTDTILQAVGDPAFLEARIKQLSDELAAQPGNREIQAAYDQSLRVFQQDSYQRERSWRLIHQFQLDQLPGDLTLRTLSGGQKTRLALALLLLEEPNLLLLDEPTNHLDIQMLEWLENWLSGFPGSMIIISHDRTFLDHTVSRIFDLDLTRHTIQQYTGNYSDYLEQYLQTSQRQMDAYRDQVYEIRRIRQDIAKTKQQALHVEITTTSQQPGPRRYAKKVARKAKAREKKLERYLDSDERLEKPKPSWQIKLEFPHLSHRSQDVLILQDLAIGYNPLPPLVDKINLTIRAGQRVVLTGPNGQGKTTLLKTIAGHLAPLSGSIRLGTKLTVGYMSQEQEIIDLRLSPLESIQRLSPLNETDARSFLHYFLFSGDDTLRPAGELSFGERARLNLATLVVSGCNFLLLDEPINHLDIPSRTSFETALSRFEGTVLAVVHDRYFIRRFATDLWILDQARINSGQLTWSD
jgi:ATP-binding cassette subfamily F protein 3